MALKDTLAREQAEKAALEEAKRNRPQVIAEWQQALTQLYDQIGALLEEHRVGGAVHLRREQITLNEPFYEQYLAPALRIIVGEKTIYVRPIGRGTIGAVGGVGLTRTVVHEYGPNHWRLLRQQANPGDDDLTWLLHPPVIGGRPAVPVRGGVAPKMGPKPLSKEAIEEVVDALLQQHC